MSTSITWNIARFNFQALSLNRRGERPSSTAKEADAITSNSADENSMKENKITINPAGGQTTQSDDTNNASTACLGIIKKFDSVQDAVFMSELAWANDFVEQVGHELIGGDSGTPLSAPEMCVLLEWSFRAGHRLGVNVAGKVEIDTTEHNKIFDEAFEQCRQDFKQYD